MIYRVAYVYVSLKITSFNALSMLCKTLAGACATNQFDRMICDKYYKTQLLSSYVEFPDAEEGYGPGKKRNHTSNTEAYDGRST